MKRIYLDNAATTPLSKGVLEKMLPYMQSYYGNPDSPHAEGRKAMAAVDCARDALAERLNAKPSEIYFTSGGTEGDNFAIVGCARAQKAKGKTRVLVSAIEHHAALAAAEGLKKEGFAVEYLPVSYEGIIEPSVLRDRMGADVALVAVMAANNETGAIQPIKELARIAREGGSVFFTDAVQYAPSAPIDVKEWGADMLAISAHKFYGPKGVGALYIKSGTPIKGLIVGGEQERGLRGGTTAVASVVGLSAAYEENVGGTYAANEKMLRLRERFLAELSGVDGLELNGSKQGLPSIVNLRIRGVNNADFVYAMDLKGVAVSAGAACASRSIQPSHVLLAMGRTEEEARECVRISFGRENTEEEAGEAGRIAKEVIESLRK